MKTQNWYREEIQNLNMSMCIKQFEIKTCLSQQTPGPDGFIGMFFQIFKEYNFLSHKHFGNRKGANSTHIIL